jgi:serine/threonine protein kinase
VGQYLHSAKVIHRDLKPSNIAINGSCEIKVPCVDTVCVCMCVCVCVCVCVLVDRLIDVFISRSEGRTGLRSQTNRSWTLGLRGLARTTRS